VRATSLFAALGLGAIALVPAAAQAATTPPATPDGDLYAIQVTVDGAMKDPTCFASQDDLDAYLAGGGVAVPGQPRATERVAGSAAAQGALGAVYKDANRKGASLTLYGSGSACNGVTPQH
jgi:hypothetical protein